MQKKSLVFIIAIYKREELTKQVLAYYKRLRKKYGFEIVVAGSEGERSRKVATGCHYIEVPNYPISEKNNAMMLEAKKFDPDAVVILGSDDFICENVIKHYYKLIEKGENKVFGFTDLYFYGLQEDILSHYNVGQKSYGAGRYFPRAVLDAMNWRGWERELNKGLDGENMQKVLLSGCEYYSIPLKEIDGFLVDVKSGFNISRKEIIFVGKQVNVEMMEEKGIKVRKPRGTKKKVEETTEEVKAVDYQAKPIPEGLKENDSITVYGTGQNKHIPKDRREKVDVAMARKLIKIGAVVYKG